MSWNTAFGTRGKIAADTTIEQCSLWRTKATGHFLVDLGHPYILLRLIIGEVDCKVSHEGENTVFVVLKTLPEIAVLGFGHSAALFLAIIPRLPGLWWRAFLLSFSQDVSVFFTESFVQTGVSLLHYPLLS